MVLSIKIDLQMIRIRKCKAKNKLRDFMRKYEQ